jgi:HD-GYP domain-containing protein (c-di-GMP phosphodiesterase class II)
MELQRKKSRQVIDPLAILAHLNDHTTLSDKLHTLLDYIRQRHTFMVRIAVTLYDENTDTIKTYINATYGKDPLPHYQTCLSDSESLTQIKNDRKPRILNDMNPLHSVNKEHANKISEIGFQSSFTVPIYKGDHFLGFIFFNSSVLNTMNHDVTSDLMVIAHLISMLITNELNFIATTKDVSNSIASLANHRNLETGQNLNLISHLARVIAHELAIEREFNDEYVEQIFIFSPLHDIGKIAIPDEILNRPGKLTAEEMALVQTHTTKGHEFIVNLQKNLDMLSPQSCEVLQNIVHYHHEYWDGSGYPKKLAGDAIPLEARIVAIADVFDALISHRVYKERWSIDKAMDYLAEKSGSQFDPDCVKIFLEKRSEVESIINKFQQA